MFGNILQPDECWMLDGRLPTVALRMNRSSKNAAADRRRFGRGIRSGESVLYPSLFDDPEQQRIVREAVRLSRRHVLPDFRGGKKAAFEFLRSLQHRPKTPYRWAAWRHWCVIRKAPRTPASPRRNSAEAGVTEGLRARLRRDRGLARPAGDFEQALEAV